LEPLDATYFLINNLALQLNLSRALAFVARVHDTFDGVYHMLESLICVNISWH